MFENGWDTARGNLESELAFEEAFRDQHFNPALAHLLEIQPDQHLAWGVGEPVPDNDLFLQQLSRALGHLFNPPN